MLLGHWALRQDRIRWQLLEQAHDGAGGGSVLKTMSSPNLTITGIWQYVFKLLRSRESLVMKYWSSSSLVYMVWGDYATLDYMVLGILNKQEVNKRYFIVTLL